MPTPSGGGHPLQGDPTSGARSRGVRLAGLLLALWLFPVSGADCAEADGTQPEVWIQTTRQSAELPEASLLRVSNRLGDVRGRSSGDGKLLVAATIQRFAPDHFAEDYTKSNWSMEFTWIEGIPFTDSDSYDLVTEADDFNLTVSVDRPTFINFLNANRTFFINSQWFFQYRKGYKDSFNSIGPWNVLATFAVFTGYFQDRLNPTLVFVWDFRSSSGGLLPQVNYRFSERFSMTVGASVFMGNQRLVNMGVNTIGPASPRSGPNAYMNASEPGLSIVRDRDEVFMTLRYTF